VHVTRKRVLVIAIAATAVAGMTGCAAARSHVAAPTGIAIAVDLPPSPATWPKYPRFSQHSCWAQPFPKDTRLGRLAPSYAPSPRAHPLSPQVVARHLLARLGDRRYVRSIKFSPAPPAVRRHYGAPADALRAMVVLPDAYKLDRLGHRSPARALANGIAWFESGIVGSALRDDLCDAGGPPLVDSASWWAIDQRFPNPAPATFRKRVALVGKHFGFTVASLRLLRPRQIAPLLIVKTTVPRKRFAKEIPWIMERLNPATAYTQHGNVQTAITFEAFFIAAEDARGPFASSWYMARGGESGGGWAVNPCLYPDTTHGLTAQNTKRCR
jgi:hypothetical protein